MATYKKRGGKIKSKSEAVNDSELLEGESTTAEVFNTLDETANKTEEWVEKNQKVILIAVGAIALTVLAYLGFVNVIQDSNMTINCYWSLLVNMYLIESIHFWRRIVLNYYNNHIQLFC